MKRKTLTVSLVLLCSMAVLPMACDKIFPGEPEEQNLLDGPLEDLSHAEAARFRSGDQLFNDKVFTPETGLGPVFVATSCGSCHPGDGKGHPFTALIRFGQSDATGNKFLDRGGPQLQNRAIPGYEPEILPPGAPFSTFLGPIVTGLGYLDLVSDRDILAMAEENRRRTDGVRGRPNWIKIPPYVKPRKGAERDDEGRYIGRFGFKASVYDLHQQTVDALNQDIGITSIFNPVDPWSGKETDPEIPASDVHDLVFYLQTLKAPIQRNKQHPDVRRGQVLFAQIGCDACHRPELKTGPSPIEGLNEVTFHPYTDLLVHDLGEEMDDGYTEGTVESSEWRTTPLWGLGLAKNSQGGQYYLMHDGRARSIHQAIMLHGGEGSFSRSQYQSLTDDEKKFLIQFLESL